MTGSAQLFPNKTAMATQLNWMFDWAKEAHGDGLIEIAHGKEKPNSARLFTPGEIDEAVQYADAVNRRGHNVYVGAALRKPGSPRGKRAGNSDCLTTGAIGVDADESTEAVAAKINAIAAPGLTVMTGTVPGLRQQFWLKLSCECSAVNQFAEATKVLVNQVGGDQNAIGAARIMRLGGSVSFPPKRKRDRGYVAELTTLTINPDADPVSIESLLKLGDDLFDSKKVRSNSVETVSQDPGCSLSPSSQKTEFGEASQARIADLLRQIRNDDCLWEKWFEVGAATHHASGGSTEGFDLWAKWSAQSPKHDRGEVIRTWGSFDNETEKPYTLGTLVHHARKDSAPRDYAELIKAVDGLKPDNFDLDVVGQIVTEAALQSPIRREFLFNKIKICTKIPLRTLREQVKLSSEVSEVDQLELARMTVDQIGCDNIVCVDAIFWTWSPNGVWQETHDRKVGGVIHSVLSSQGMEVSAALVNSVTDVMKTAIFKQGHQFNVGNPETVNCLNGELELVDGAWVLAPHCREHYRTTQIPVEYDAGASAPRFTMFLEEVFLGDSDKEKKIRALLELAGYTLMSHARHEKFVLAIGPGANGKSVFLAVLETLCGSENVAGVQPSNFDRTFQRAHLHQKLANIITELRQGEVIADAELKAITSGEPSTVEHKFKDPFVMRPFSTCWFGTNHMPHTRDFSDALFRRATVLTFNRTFAKSEQDPLLKDKLKTELPGILNLALDAYARALQAGFTEPPSSVEAKAEWRLETDQVAQFMEECCERDPDGSEKSAILYSTYTAWAEREGITRTMSHRGFRQRLTRMGFGQGRDKYGKVVTGLRVRSVR